LIGSLLLALFDEPEPQAVMASARHAASDSRYLNLKRNTSLQSNREFPGQCH
jgi:hypothetical protein